MCSKGKAKFLDSFNKTGKFALCERFVVIIRKRIAGICGLYRYKAHPKNFAGIGWFALRKKYQGKGIGKHLVHYMEKIAKTSGNTKIFVWADKKPCRFYKKLGFRVSKFSIKPKEAEFLLVKNLI